MTTARRLPRVGDPDREIGQEGGQLVARLPALVRGTGRNGYQCTDAAAVDRLAAGDQVSAEPPGHRGHDDIVDRAANRVLDHLDVGEVRPGPLPSSSRPDRTVQPILEVHSFCTGMCQPV